MWGVCPPVSVAGSQASPYITLQRPPWRPSPQGSVGQKDLPRPAPPPTVAALWEGGAAGLASPSQAGVYTHMTECDPDESGPRGRRRVREGSTA